MTCCLLLSLFADGLFDRGRAPRSMAAFGRSRPTRPAGPARLLVRRLGQHWLAWLGSIAVLELVAAWLLVRTLIDLDSTSRQPMTMTMAAGASGRGLSPAAAAVALGLVLGALALGSVVIRADSGRRAVYAGFGCFVVASVPVVRTAATQSHLIFMGQTMLVLVVAPALLITAVSASTRPAAGLDTGLGLLAAGGYLVVLYLWHLPITHDAAMANPGWDWIRLASCAAVGAAFWASARNRLGAQLVMGVGSGLLGLALVVGPQPLFAMDGNALGLSGLTDQRLAGLLMLIVDLTVLLPLAGRTADQPVPVAA
jgi:hypothetical protein